MKKAVLLFAVSLLCATLGATIWHVNTNIDLGPDFTSLSTAVADASVLEGDTLYVYGSPLSYSNINLNKRLTIIGPGYFLSENTGLQQNHMPAILGTMNVNAAAAGSVISGLSVTEALNLNAQTCVVQRCKLTYLSVNSSNCIVTQCFISNNTYSHTCTVNQNVQNILVANCYLWDSINYASAIYIPTNSTATVSNCLIRGSVTANNTEFYNNIVAPLTDMSFTSNANTVCYNNVLIDHATFTYPSCFSPSTNLIDVTAQVFTGTGSTDGCWQLCAGSPAIGYGVGGVDCGIFGGLAPYKLSGIPAIPTIYEFYAPATGFTIPVQIGARSNN